MVPTVDWGDASSELPDQWFPLWTGGMPAVSSGSGLSRLSQGTHTQASLRPACEWNQGLKASPGDLDRQAQLHTFVNCLSTQTLV